jgi:hypothetical protein
MPQIQIDNPVEVVRNAILALRSQKAALQRQTAEIDKQLGAIVELASSPDIPVPAAERPACTVEGTGVNEPKPDQYAPRSGSCAAVVLEVMSDGKERTSQEIQTAVKEKLGAEFKAVTLYQAMTKLTSRQLVASVKNKPGNWVLISNKLPG